VKKTREQGGVEPAFEEADYAMDGDELLAAFLFVVTLAALFALWHAGHIGPGFGWR